MPLALDRPHPPAPGDDGDVLVFIHVMKTAGTSLGAKLAEWVGRPAVWPHGVVRDPTAVLRSYLVPDELRRADRADLDRVDLVGGHHPASVVGLVEEVVGRRAVPVTLLRDPVARTLSLLRQHRALFPDLRDRSLEELYDDEFLFRRLILDHQVKVFSLGPDQLARPAAVAGHDHPVTEVVEALLAEGVPWTRALAEVRQRWPRDAHGPRFYYSVLGGPVTADVAVDDADLATAKATLDALPFVGTSERVEDLVDQLAAALGRQRVSPVPRLNTTRAERDHPALRRRIAADCWRDVELYEHVLGVVEERVA